jgi:hypothetical protein
VQQNDDFLMHHEDHPCDTVGQPGADLPETMSQGIHEWLPYGPGLLDRLDVRPDLLLFLLRQVLEPFPDRLIAGDGGEEMARKRAR